MAGLHLTGSQHSAVVCLAAQIIMFVHKKHNKCTCVYGLIKYIFIYMYMLSLLFVFRLLVRYQKQMINIVVFNQTVAY